MGWRMDGNGMMDECAVKDDEQDEFDFFSIE